MCWAWCGEGRDGHSVSTLGCGCVVDDFVDAECPGDCGARGANARWDAEEVAAVAAVGLLGGVGDLDDGDRFAIEVEVGLPELAVVILRWLFWRPRPAAGLQSR